MIRRIYGNNGLLYPGTGGDNTSSSSMWTKDGKAKVERWSLMGMTTILLAGLVMN